MNLGHGIFAVKLYELERAYGQMRSRLQICQGQDHGKVRQELQVILDEYQENELLLQKNVEASRSPAIAALSEAQLTYCRTTEELMRRKMSSYLHSERSSHTEDRAEAVTLYAEYAIDFATQAMRHALLAALSAIDVQMDCEERKEKEE